MTRAIQPGDTLDLIGVPCPENATRATLRLDLMDEGEVLEMLLSDTEATATFLANLEEEGYKVLSQTQRADGTWRVLITPQDL